MRSTGIPQYVRQVAPEVHGQQMPGLAHRANAGIGEAIAGFGAKLAAWAERKGDLQTARREREAERTAIVAASGADRDLDNRRLRYMLELKDPERRKELTAVSVDPVTGDERSGYDAELDRFGDWMKGQFDELSATMSPRAKQLFEVEYNKKYEAWSGQFVSAVDQLEIEDVTAQAQGLAKEGRAADALALADLYKDRLGPELHGQLAMQLAISGARADLQQVAQVDGWDAARQQLQDPAWQEMYGLDLSEAAGVRGELAGFVNEQEQIAENTRLAKVEQAGDEWLVAAERGQADLDAGLDMVQRNELPYSIYEQGKRFMLQPPEQNDPAVYEGLLALEDGVARGAVPAKDLKEYLRTHASGLTASTRQAAMERAGSPFTRQTQARNDAVQRAYGQFVHVEEIDAARRSDLYRQGFTPAMIADMENRRAQQLNLVNMLGDELEEWIQKNPDATRAEIIRRGREIQVLISGRAIEEQDRMIGAWERGEEITFAGGERKKGQRTPLTSGTLLPQEAATGPAALIVRTRDIDKIATPEGLASIWGELDPEAKADVMRLLARGKTAAEILKIWQEGQ